jgi:nucleoside-diphosphate-sugar epimerase
VSARVVAITGASGVIGRHLCDHLRDAGWTVRALLRDPSSYPFAARGIECFRLHLPRALDEGAFAGADFVIHAAWTTRFTKLHDARRVNEDGTARVQAVTQAVGARFVFVSSLAARADAESYYGRSKHAMEGLAGPRDLVVRPGLVLARDGGLAHRLGQAMARTRIAPQFGGGRQIVQTVHIADLTRAFERALSGGMTGALNVAEPDGLPIGELLRLLAKNAGVRALPLPVPVGPALMLLRAAEAVGMPLPVSSENLLGLVALRHVDTRADIAKLDMTLRTARQSLETLR